MIQVRRRNYNTNNENIFIIDGGVHIREINQELKYKTYLVKQKLLMVLF